MKAYKVALVMIARNESARIVRALANEPETLAGIKAHLDLHRRSLPLFDAERLARDMDALLTRMHDRHLAGLAPQALLAEAP